MPPPMPPIEPRRTTVNGLAYEYLACGEGPLALCVHGFPDTPRGFEPLLEALAGAGHRAIAPWMRGYAPTAVPPDGTSALPAWIADVTALHEQFGQGEPGVLIGHDWGAFAAYGAAALAPERWGRVITGSLPPPLAMLGVLGDYDQVKKFWYQYLFLRPGSEDIVAADDLEFIRRLWQDWSPGLDVTEAIGPVKDALRQPANLTAALSTYRVMFGAQELSDAEATRLTAESAAAFTPHTQPTLYLQGADDGCVVREAFTLAADFLPAGSRTELLEGAGHFFQYEQPDRFIQLVLDFLS